MKKGLCILMVCLLLLSGLLYVLSGYRLCPKSMPINRISIWKETVDDMLNEKKKEMGQFDNLFDEMAACITIKSNGAFSLINSWIDYISERVNQYGK